MKQFYKRILVTGGAGFIGSHLVDLLLKEGHYVTVVDNLCNGRLSNLKKWEKHSQFKFVHADIRRPEDFQGVFSDIEWVFHLAALPGVIRSLEQPREYFETNVEGTYNVLKASQIAGVQRFLYAASASCYGTVQQYPTPETAPIQPQTPYALTKYLGEQLVLHWAQAHQLPALSLRLFNVFGPRLCMAGSYASVFGIFLAQKLQGIPLTIVGDGSQTRDFIYVSDVAEAFYAAAQSDLSNESMNVGSACSYSINLLAKLFGGAVTYIPKRSGEIHCSLADVEKIYKKLSWKAKISLEEGVWRLIEGDLSCYSSHAIGSHELMNNDLFGTQFLPAQKRLFAQLDTANRVIC